MKISFYINNWRKRNEKKNLQCDILGKAYVCMEGSSANECTRQTCNSRIYKQQIPDGQVETFFSRTIAYLTLARLAVTKAKNEDGRILYSDLTRRWRNVEVSLHEIL